MRTENLRNKLKKTIAETLSVVKEIEDEIDNIKIDNAIRKLKIIPSVYEWIIKEDGQEDIDVNNMILEEFRTCKADERYRLMHSYDLWDTEIDIDSKIYELYEECFMFDNQLKKALESIL
jgi:hypothetical protein